MIRLNDSNNNAGTRLQINIIGDSMLNNISSRGISKTEAVNILNISGLKSSDIVDYTNPSIKNKCDAIVCHVGTNDLPQC